METVTQKIKIKIGDAEFEAEGPSELVRAQFSEFMAAINRAPAIAPLATPVVPPTGAVGDTPPPSDGISTALMSRVFRTDNGISLYVIPKGDNSKSDGLLLLLYGFAKLVNEHTVTGTSLMQAAKRSGLNIDRVDRFMVNNEQFTNSSGLKKGKRYSLNNRGIQQAEKIIKESVE